MGNCQCLGTCSFKSLDRGNKRVLLYVYLMSTSNTNLVILMSNWSACGDCRNCVEPTYVLCVSPQAINPFNSYNEWFCWVFMYIFLRKYFGHLESLYKSGTTHTSLNCQSRFMDSSTVSQKRVVGVGEGRWVEAVPLMSALGGLHLPINYRLMCHAVLKQFNNGIFIW